MLIHNGTVITWNAANPLIRDGAVLIRDGAIVEVGRAAVLAEQHSGEERLDATGQLIMPGLICAHTHFYGAYARGLGIPGDAPADFPQILERLWWNIDRALDPDAVRYSVLVSLVDAIKHGTTTLIDHHASPSHIAHSLDWIADAVDLAGLRAVLGYEVTDRNGEEGAQAGIEENLRFIKTNGQRPRVRGVFGLHASLTLHDATLRQCADRYGGTFHIHAAEHEADEDDSLAKYGKRVIERLDSFGMVNPRSLIAHCVHIDDAEMSLLAERGAWVTHQPRSNMNNAVGAMRFDDMVARGVKLVLGNDGFSNAMWEEWKAAYLLHKVAARDPRKANGADVARVAAGNNADLVSMLFEQPIGRLMPGARADIILVDYQPFTPFTEGNLPWHILFGFEPSMVTTTMVDGRILMRDRVLQMLDERQIMAEALAHAPGVWQRFNHFAGA